MKFLMLFSKLKLVLGTIILLGIVIFESSALAEVSLQSFMKTDSYSTIVDKLKQDGWLIKEDDSRNMNIVIDYHGQGDTSLLVFFCEQANTSGYLELLIRIRESFYTDEDGWKEKWNIEILSNKPFPSLIHFESTEIFEFPDEAIID